MVLFDVINPEKSRDLIFQNPGIGIWLQSRDPGISRDPAGAWMWLKLEDSEQPTSSLSLPNLNPNASVKHIVTSACLRHIGFFLRSILGIWQELCSTQCDFFALPTNFARSTLAFDQEGANVLNYICVMLISTNLHFLYPAPDQSSLHCEAISALCSSYQVTTLAYLQYAFCIVHTFSVCICICTSVFGLIFSFAPVLILWYMGGGRGCLWCHIGLYAIACGGSCNARDAGTQWCGAKL